MRVFESIEIANTDKLTKGEYTFCTFSNCDFSGLDFMHFRFEDCEFKNCNLSNCYWNETQLQQVRFANCKMIGNQFDKANPFLLELHFDNYAGSFVHNFELVDE